MGTIYIVSTPIGNLEDITIRAIKTLFSVDYIVCEDTRITGLLLQELSKRYSSIIRIIELKSPKLISYYDEVEIKRLPEIIEYLETGKNVALVSDAGTPLISDPGYKLVHASVKRNIKVISIPGPAAFLTALTSSGLPTNNFLFLGYPPEKHSHRIKLFHNLFQCFKTLEQKPTFIFYCAPHKLKETLSDIKDAFGDIEITIARELTKIHEEIEHVSLSEIIPVSDGYKGEIVILF